MKSYDSVDWDFILQCLLSVGTPMRYVCWVWECITSPKFSIALNGTLVGYFEGRKGLRQGAPISPYLLSLLWKFCLSWWRRFHGMSMNSVFHLGCTEIKLTHLCFVDDLLIFSMEKCMMFRALTKYYNILLLYYVWIQIQLKVIFIAPVFIKGWRSRWGIVCKWRKGNYLFGI